MVWEKFLVFIAPYLDPAREFVLPHLYTMGHQEWIPLLGCFIFFSFLMVARLNAIERNGFEGTIVGTLVMPYFSGFPNLCFAYLIATTTQINGGALVMENCLTNNVTNLTVVLAVPALIWGLDLLRRGEKYVNDNRIQHLSLLLTLTALIFFTASVWVLGRDGTINTNDGFMLVGVFFFWQAFQVFDVLKNNARKQQAIPKRLLFDFAVIAICAWGIFASVEGLLDWINMNMTGAWVMRHLGTISGILMVLPNAFPAFYYAAINRADIAYSSQVGDCHICIPLCIGVFAIFNPLVVPAYFETALFILMGAASGLLILTAFLGRLPRWTGLILLCLYAYFMLEGIIL
ncbi:MAG: hypothetical protein MI747_06055 [Desulfobacterales bacterium]|nr:hypothetical protein [Desulfobacterales bacterium]